MLTLAIEYLTGNAVATDPGNRETAEWPPHPGRVFMALAAAWFETRPHATETDALPAWEAEGVALRWLEALAAPVVLAGPVDTRTVVDVYVPPNDLRVTDERIIPARRTNRQPRTFPTVRLLDDEPVVRLRWDESPDLETHEDALARLCAKVIRVGHSSSLVRMWIEPSAPQSTEIPAAHILQPFDPLHEDAPVAALLRVATPGCLDYLAREYNGDAIEAFYQAGLEIDAARGKTKKTLQAAFLERFGQKWGKSATPPPSRRPRLGVSQSYRRPAEPTEPIHETPFDPAMLVLAYHDGPSLGLETTWQVCTALYNVLAAASDGGDSKSAPAWVTGHASDGSPLQAPHLAIAPLPFAGGEYADGHLMGLAVIFPREVPSPERGKLLRQVRAHMQAHGTRDPGTINLTLGKLGTWTLQREQRAAPPQALRLSTWTQPSRVWASVTPVVLDRHPKIDPHDDPDNYRAAMRAIIARSCEVQGLPVPAEIQFGKTSWIRGAPRAKPGPDGFPLMPTRPGANRQQVHVRLVFPEAVRGPLLLGAGRYRGYGFMRPLPHDELTTTDNTPAEDSP